MPDTAVSGIVIACIETVDVVHDRRDGFFIFVRGLNYQMGMSVHDAIAVELEAMFVLIVGDYAE